MTRLGGISIVVVAVVACGSKAKPPETSPAAQAGCDPAFAVACGDGLVDGCSIKDAAGAALTLDHACVVAGATAGPPCAQEIALTCDEQGARLAVPAQMIDACLLTPAAAATHVCVVKPDATIGGGSGTGTP